jgi:hypothetical protein
MRIVDTTFDRLARFDAVIATCGYETRSSYLCRMGLPNATRGYAVLHTNPITEVALRNRDLYQGQGWIISDLVSALDACSLQAEGNPDYAMCIDVSSMPRQALAQIVEWLTRDKVLHVKVTFAYCPADFDASAQVARRVEPMSAAPISKFFAGELRAPSTPIGLIIGLGLEPHRAIGLIEFLEPAQTWAFVSTSLDSRFDTATAVLHQELLAPPEGPSVFKYDVRSVAQTYAALDSLVFSAGLKYRLLMAPSGPKLFTLACLLVALPRVSARPAVWRIGGEGNGGSMDVVEAGDVIAVDVSMSN